MYRDTPLGRRRSVALWWLLATAAVVTLLMARAAGAAPQSPGDKRSQRTAPETEQNAETRGSADSRGANQDALDDEEAPVYKTNAEWKRLLTRKQYRVARLGETEPPYKGKYCKNKAPGDYHCVCCDAVLFNSRAKFESGTGWPSFFAPVKQERLFAQQDFSDGSLRIEVTCKRCGAHLGHVFADGPPPTGLRFCINSASLDFEEADSDNTAD